MADSVEPLAEPVALYAPRIIRFEGVEQVGAFRLKRYHIHRRLTSVSHRLVGAAVACVASHLSASPPAPMLADRLWWTLPSHRLGSLIVHEGADANFVLLDHWVDSSMLRHHVWASPLTDPTALQSIREADLAMCVWELAVIQHERAAWLRHVFRGDGAADVDAYLRDVIAGTI